MNTDKTYIFVPHGLDVIDSNLRDIGYGKRVKIVILNNVPKPKNGMVYINPVNRQGYYLVNKSSLQPTTF